MNGQKKSRKKGVYFFLTLFMVMAAGIVLAPGRAAASAAGQDASVSMEVTYGFNDMAKGDRYLRVTVLLNNERREDFTGSLQVLTTESSMEVYRYDYPVTVDAGGELEQSYYIPLGVKTDQMFVGLYDPQGTQVLRKRIKLNIGKDISESFMGVFSDHPEELQYMDGVGIHYGSIKTTQVHLNSATAPEDPLGYDQLDLIVVSDYDLNSLSEQQHSAISRWVENGGTLLIGGGERYRESMGRFAAEILEPPYGGAEPATVNLGSEYSQNAPQDAVLELSCADLNLKNGSALMQGDGFPLLSYVHKKKGRIVAAAFALGDIGPFCETRPAFLEKFLTMSFGENKTNELSQMEYYGFSRLYFAVQGLINTGNAGRLPNVVLYSAVILLYLLLIGPGIYLCLKKRMIHRYYMVGVTACALIFTGLIYIMGVKTRFREPFFTYATILDATDGRAEEETYVNVRSPYNKPYSVRLNPDYIVRPVTKSYYYESTTAEKFTGNETYKTNLNFQKDWTEIRVRDTVAFTPKLFLLKKQLQNTAQMGIDGTVRVFGGEMEGSVVNHFGYRLENAVLLLYGRAVLLGDMEPGQEVELTDREILNYPLSYTYALAQKMTGADQFEKTDIDDENYLRAQERSRLLSFYLDNSMSGGYTSEGRVVAFAPDRDGQEFLAEGDFISEGITMVTSRVSVDRKKDGLVYRPALEQDPNVISGNYDVNYNAMYTGEPSEPAIIEYSLGNDLEIEHLDFVKMSSAFVNNPQYPYLSAFEGEIYFYNYDTGRNDLMEEKESYTAKELEPYLSPSNTLTVKYVNEGSNENGWERQLPMIYTVGREK